MSSLRAVNGELGGAPRAGRCVVLAGPEGAASPLLSGLTRRGMAAVVVRDPPGVMVALARGEASALIFASGADEADAADLLDAMQTYYPHTGCWAYRCEADEAVGQLVKVADAPPGGEAVDLSVAEVLPGSAPGDPRPGGRERSAVSESFSESARFGEGDDDAPLISREEMTMLLGQGASERGHGSDD